MSARRLPPHDELVKMIMSGWSYPRIAQKYGVEWSTVYATLKRGQRLRGGPWPILTEKQRVAKIHLWNNEATLNPMLIAMVLEEYLEDNSMTLREFARRSNMNPSRLYGIKSGRIKRISREYAIRLLKALGEPVPRELYRAS